MCVNRYEQIKTEYEPADYINELGEFVMQTLMH